MKEDDYPYPENEGKINFLTGSVGTGRSFLWRTLQSMSENGETMYSWNRETREVVPIENVDRFGMPRRKDRRKNTPNIFVPYPLSPHNGDDI